MDLKQLMITMGVFGLCLFAIMSFIITTQADNSVGIPITNNTLINQTYGDLYSEISSSQTRTQNVLNTFGTTTPTQEYGELEITSIVSPTRTIRTMIIGLWNIFIKLPQVVLGVSPVVSYMVSAIIGLLVIIGIWAIWKGAFS